MIILKTEKISKHYDGVRAVDGLDIAFDKGRIIGVVGPNGSGKSTLINLLTGITPWDSGVVRVGNIKLDRLSPEDAPEYGLSRTFQEVRLFEQMPVLDNVLIVLTKRNIFGAIFEKHSYLHLAQAEEILKSVDLWGKRKELVQGLSYGQRKLLEIARALAMKSDTYFFDEPFAGLFPEMTQIVVSILEKLREQGKTVVLIEHNMDLIRQLSDWVCVLDSGKLLAEGASEKVLSQKEVIEAYLGD